MITHSDIDIVMNALSGTPMVTTAKFADKIQSVLAKEIPIAIVSAGDDESDWVYCPRCGETLGVNEDVYNSFADNSWNPIYCHKCGQAVVWNTKRPDNK